MITAQRLSSLESMLAGDHDRLDRAFQAIVTRAYGGDFQQLEAEWLTFQDALLQHLDAEEKHLIPALAKDRPGAAERCSAITRRYASSSCSWASIWICTACAPSGSRRSSTRCGHTPSARKRCSTLGAIA